MTSIIAELPASDQQALVILCAATVVCLRFVDQRRSAHAWAAWTMALLAVTLPLADFVPRPNWAHVGLVPFSSAPLKLSDVAANVVLYVPFGWIAAAYMDRIPFKTVAIALGAAFGVSLTAEIAQLFSVFRYPSATDVVCNVAGAGAGALLMMVSARISGRQPVYDGAPLLLRA